MQVLKEPILHFLMIGVALFGTHTLVAQNNGVEAAGRNTIRITAADAERLGNIWARQWSRPPTADEVKGILTAHLKEEVLVREARQLKLDQDDTVVRRRLAQKMTFLLEDTTSVPDVPEAELRALYEAKPEISQTPARVSFVQVFFKGEEGEDRARVALASLDTFSDPVQLGDPLLLGHVFTNEDEQSLTKLFGPSFAPAVVAAKPGGWSGPFRSGYGLHLVKITAVTAPEYLPFESVRVRLEQEWRLADKERGKQQLYSGLIGKYEVFADPEIRPFLEHLLKPGASP